MAAVARTFLPPGRARETPAYDQRDRGGLPRRTVPEVPSPSLAEGYDARRPVNTGHSDLSPRPFSPQSPTCGSRNTSGGFLPALRIFRCFLVLFSIRSLPRALSPVSATLRSRRSRTARSPPNRAYARECAHSIFPSSATALFPRKSGISACRALLGPDTPRSLKPAPLSC